MTIHSHSQEETKHLALQMAKNAKVGDVFCLLGDLGVGKTVFAKGFAEGLGVTEDVTSPTFTLQNSYESGRLPFHHFDVYRVEDSIEFEDAGCLDFIGGDGVCLVEWAERVLDVMPKHAVFVRIRKDWESGDDFRVIEIDGGA